MEKLCDMTPVHAYSESGFSFAGGEVRHTGAVLIMPEGVYAWPAVEADALTPEDLEPAVAAAPRIDFILLGTGSKQVFPAPKIHAACAEAGLGLEVMATGPACRTLQVLLAEERQFAAALLPAGQGADRASNAFPKE